MLDWSNGIIGVVKKKRTIYRIENAKIHLDKVENLGDFFEIELAIVSGEEKKGEEIIFQYMEKFGIKKENLIDVAYQDLLANKNQK